MRATQTPVSVPAAVPDWLFYHYDDRGYLAYRGQLVATRACPTTDELGRLLVLRDRLNAGAVECSEACRA